MSCTINVASEEYADFITTYSSSPEEFIRSGKASCIDFINHRFAVIHVPLSTVLPLRLSTYTYPAVPKLYSLLDASAMEAAGILPASRVPAFSNQGEGVIIGFVDTGIDYTNPLFRFSNGSTRILGIWDQTIENPDKEYQDLLYGTQYTREDIDRALSLADPFSLLPSRDENGHGTFLASVAAGNSDPQREFTGAAPRAYLAAVRLKPAKKYLRDFYLIREDAEAYQENDIMMGISYLMSLSRKYSMPMVICLGLGTNQGSHTGRSPLGLYMNDLSSYFGVVLVTAAGNETGYGHHYSASLTAGEKSRLVELNVGKNDPGFSMELWAQDVEVYRVGFVSPTGEVIEPLPSAVGEENVIRFLVEQTEITVYTDIVSSASGSQMIFIRFRDPMPGIWSIRVVSVLDITGTFHIWLPCHGFLSDDTRFLLPDPDTVITEPGNAQLPITVSAYDHTTGGIYIHSGRGYSRSGQIKPELAAPGTGILGSGKGGSFTKKTGTSVSAALTSGAAAILLHWGILQRNYPFMNTSVVKTWLIRGAKRNPASSYPNREFGYGTLDLYETFFRLRL